MFGRRILGQGWQLLDEVSEPGTPDYPYGEKGQMQRSRRISGGRVPGRSGPFPEPERPVSKAGVARFQSPSGPCPEPERPVSRARAAARA